MKKIIEKITMKQLLVVLFVVLIAAIATAWATHEYLPSEEKELLKDLVGRALAYFTVISSVILCWFSRKHPMAVRGCCIIIGGFALILSFIGVAAEYELIPCVPEFIWDFCGGFNPVSTVYAAFSGFMLSILPNQTDGENTPKKTKKKKKHK